MPIQLTAFSRPFRKMMASLTLGESGAGSGSPATAAAAAERTPHGGGSSGTPAAALLTPASELQTELSGRSSGSEVCLLKLWQRWTCSLQRCPNCQCLPAPCLARLNNNVLTACISADQAATRMF